MFLGAAVVLVVVFLLSQTQGDVDVSYARSPSGKDAVREGDAGEWSGVGLPSVEEMTAMVRRDRVVRLPGSVAYWDTGRVERAIGGADIRILVAPPGLSDRQQDQVRDVEAATIRILGLDVSGSVYGAAPDDLASWRGVFATGDVTGLLLSLVASERKESAPPEVDLFSWRVPSAGEVAPVVADLRAGGVHVAAGATLGGLPGGADTAFGGRRPLVAAFPVQPFGQPVAEYGPALVKAFPGVPVVVMYGDWVAYYGPFAGDFAEVVGAGFYARFGSRLSTYAYPQGAVLGTYLNSVTDVRFAGLFDRPLPYQPYDPLRVALPALPWLFGLCVLVFLVLSVRSVLGSKAPPRRPPGRLAGLTTLAVELSSLSHAPGLTRALGRLEAARSALAEGLPDRHVAGLLSDAQRDLDSVARGLGRAEYRPVNYLAGGVSWRG
ncbi:hypothetical protein [Actinophytocola oryzae]|uniref:hypothetical protein n=1 Tax=Actinophytocola oryzae TaxID=502181 RepID=UPI001FBAE815|nr:hypothetical protein [Actinophytocola oryzae]